MSAGHLQRLGTRRQPTPEEEERQILLRLRSFDVIHVGRLEGKRAVERLALRGLVKWGEGERPGIWLVRHSTRPPRTGGRAA